MAKKAVKKGKALGKGASKGKSELISDDRLGLKQVAEVRKEIIDFLSLEKPQKIAIVADNDPDGFTAALQIKKFLDSKQHDSIVFFYDHFARTSLRFLDLFVSFAPQKTIFLDLAEDLVSECLEAIGHYTGKFVSIDHHVQKDIHYAEFDFKVVKPGAFSRVAPSQYPVSKMVFDLFNGVNWLCAIGVIGDSSSEQWPELLKHVYKKYNASYDDMNEFGALINAVMLKYPEKKQELFVDFYRAEKPHDLFKSQFFELKKEYAKRLEEMELEFRKKAERFPELNLVFFETAENLTCPLVNKISKENPSTTFVFYETPGNYCKASLRCQTSEIDCKALAEYSVKGVQDASGGGHVPASGATFPLSHLPEFKRRIIEYVGKHRKK